MLLVSARIVSKWRVPVVKQTFDMIDSINSALRECCHTRLQTGNKHVLRVWADRKVASSDGRCGRNIKMKACHHFCAWVSIHVLHANRAVVL